MAHVITNTTPFDAWSLVHLATGIVLGAVGLPLPQTVAGLAAFEVLEWTLEHPSGSPIFGTKRPESEVNVAADIGPGPPRLRPDAGAPRGPRGLGIPQRDLSLAGCCYLCYRLG